MLVIAKVALGLAATVGAAGAYTFHEGVVKIDLDENRPDGSHIHFWVPATAVPAALRLMPQKEVDKALCEALEYLPTARAAVKGLEQHPDFELVDVESPDQHVKISSVNGRLKVDVSEPGDEVHVAVPLSMVQEVLDQLSERAQRHSAVVGSESGS